MAYKKKPELYMIISSYDEKVIATDVAEENIIDEIDSHYGSIETESDVNSVLGDYEIFPMSSRVPFTLTPPSKPVLKLKK